MKQTLLIILFLSVGFSQQEYNINDLIEMDNGLFTVKFSDEPITGKVYGYFGKDGEELTKVYIGKLINGKKDGKWTIWYHNTGTKSYEENWKDGELDGLSTNWSENGQKEYEGTWKDGKQDGLHTVWYENGQKKLEVNYKDGELDGLWTWWYENGQKESEWTFKDGELISSKIWNEDGSVKE